MVVADQDTRCLGGRKELCVGITGEEGDLTVLRVFDSTNSVYRTCTITNNNATNTLCEFINGV